MAEEAKTPTTSNLGNLGGELDAALTTLESLLGEASHAVAGIRDTLPQIAALGEVVAELEAAMSNAYRHLSVPLGSTETTPTPTMLRPMPPSESKPETIESATTPPEAERAQLEAPLASPEAAPLSEPKPVPEAPLASPEAAPLSEPKPVPEAPLASPQAAPLSEPTPAPEAALASPQAAPLSEPEPAPEASLASPQAAPLSEPEPTPKASFTSPLTIPPAEDQTEAEVAPEAAIASPEATPLSEPEPAPEASLASPEATPLSEPEPAPEPIQLKPETEQPAATPSEGAPDSPASNSLQLSITATSGSLDLKAVDRSINESPAVVDVTLLDYDGRNATLKVWITESADPAGVREALLESLRRNFGGGQDTEVSIDLDGEQA